MKFTTDSNLQLELGHRPALSALPWLGNATRPTRRDVSQNTFGMATSFSRAQTNEMSLSDKL